MPTHPLIQQGTLNRVRCSVVVANFTNLNVTAPYMGKQMARLTYEGDFTEQIGTATGGVNSPEPYVWASIAMNLLRTQNLAAQWMAQAQDTTAIGPVTIYSDTSAFPAISLDNASIRNIDPGAFDGSDPVVRVTVRGIFYVNNELWSLS